MFGKGKILSKKSKSEKENTSKKTQINYNLNKKKNEWS